MVVWQIIGNEIGPNDCGAAYYPTKREAEQALRDYNTRPGDYPGGDGPFKILIRSRQQLADQLNDAMGYGGT